MRIETDESNLGNLIADAIRWYINKNACDFADKDNKIAFSVVSNGVIRNDIIKGKSGKIAVCDAFRTIPLGAGFDGTMGYPLVSFYLYPSEIKKGLEILTSIYPIKGESYFLQISGAKFTYNPNRMLFDRVTQIQVGSEEVGSEEKGGTYITWIAFFILMALFCTALITMHFIWKKIRH